MLEYPNGESSRVVQGNGLAEVSLAATIAPVGSELQDDYQAPEEPEIDLAGLEVAPVGSDLDTSKKEPDPPPPDTTGITMAE